MKRILKWSVAGLALLLLVVYVQFLLLSEGPNRFEGTGRITLLQEERQIELPWYLTMGDTQLFFSENGTDADGREYTCFCYENMPTLFECEMWIVVNWTDGTSAIYVGESRGMEFIYDEYGYPEIEWSETA